MDDRAHLLQRGGRVPAKPDWETDGAGWPLRHASRFADAGGVRWHVQLLGAGPAVLLLHGAGGATHSWSRLAPLLARSFTLVAPDLPGHGFTGTPAGERLTLPGVASLVSSLLRQLDVSPVLAVGHSAGAAVAARMAIDGAIRPRGLVGLAPALAAFDPAPGILAPLVGAVARSGIAAGLLSRLAMGPTLASTLRSTGSRLDDEMIELYRRLSSRPGHVNGVLAMMSRWDVAPLLADLPRLSIPCELVIPANDRWIARAPVERAARRIPRHRLVDLPGAGHLAHEEMPGAVAGIILRFARETGVLDEASPSSP
jgi:magnesium chelatase accessory protein